MKPRKVKGLDPGAPLGENAARIALERLAELRSFAAEALAREASGAQHDMRIAAKRLRYALEITGVCFDRAGADARRAARDLQEVLGALHDCDVMIPRIERHAASLRGADAAAIRGRADGGPDLNPRLSVGAPNRLAYPGLALLEVHFEARRRLLFDRFAELWRELESSGVWERLELVARRRLASSGPVAAG